ncbi:MAG: thymidine phosphorylase, partial [Chloroflexota bacterium]
FALSFFTPSTTFDALLSMTDLSRVELEAVLERLNALSLVDLLPGEERYSMHPLTRAYIHQDLHNDPKTMQEISLRFVRLWVDYATKYGGSSKTYNLIESEWMNLKVAYGWAKNIAGIKGEVVENEDAALLGVNLVRSLQPYLLFSKRWDEGMAMDAFGYDAAHALNIPYLRAFTIESPDERTDISFVPEMKGEVVSQRISPSTRTKKSQISNSPTQRNKGMRAVDIIVKKRDGLELTGEEIRFFINGISKGDIPDYQTASWSMATLLNGMTVRETRDLTLAMAQSGDILDLSDIGHPVVDKHSTGGVGDKTTLIVLPIVAACGLPVGKMSGRGLGFSGGTLDKMESIPGYRVNLTTEEYKRQLLEIGIVLTGQTLSLAPVDGKLYALRDVTGSVPSIPLIASSILSKKIASGAHAILLDVKVGLGSFMQQLEEARELAALMVAIGELAGRKTVSLLSDMNQPLGYAVGNALEVREAIETLHGGGPKDLIEHCLRVSAHMLVLGEIAKNTAVGYEMARKAITDGRAFNKFRAMIGAQGGDVSYVDNPNKLPQAKYIEVVKSPYNGYLAQINARTIGETMVKLGGGRAKKGDQIDHAVGIVVHHKVGDAVRKGEPLFTLHSNNLDLISETRESVLSAHTWSKDPIARLPLFYE